MKTQLKKLEQLILRNSVKTQFIVACFLNFALLFLLMLLFLNMYFFLSEETAISVGQIFWDIIDGIVFRLNPQSVGGYLSNNVRLELLIAFIIALLIASPIIFALYKSIKSKSIKYISLYFLSLLISYLIIVFPFEIHTKYNFAAVAFPILNWAMILGLIVSSFLILKYFKNKILIGVLIFIWLFVFAGIIKSVYMIVQYGDEQSVDYLDMFLLRSPFEGW